MPLFSDDPPIEYPALLGARLEKVRAEGPVNADLIERLVYPEVITFEEYGEPVEMPAWTHPADPKHDPALCRCAQEQGYPYRTRRRTRRVMVRLAGPPERRVEVRLHAPPSALVTAEGPRLIGRTSDSPVPRGSFRAPRPRLTFGHDVVPHPEPLSLPAFYVAPNGTDTRPDVEHMAVKIARASTDTPPAARVPERDWAPGEPLSDGSWTQERLVGDRVVSRVIRTEVMGDEPLRATAPRFPAVPLDDPVLVDAFLIRLQASEGLEGLLAFAHA